jgi:lysozyme
MRVNEKGLEIIKQYEGLRLKPYLCQAGVPTVGYGATTYLDGSKVQMTDKAITKKMADALLVHHVKFAEDAVNNLVKVSITEDQFSALVSLVFNIGVGAFKDSTLLKLLNLGSIQAAGEQITRWNKVGGKPSDGLTKRRKSEYDLYTSQPVILKAPSEQDINDILKKLEDKALKDLR